MTIGHIKVDNNRGTGYAKIKDKKILQTLHKTLAAAGFQTGLAAMSGNARPTVIFIMSHSFLW